MSPVKPMLACTATNEQIQTILDQCGYLYGSPKLDGIRATVQNGVVYSRSLKPIKSKFVQDELGHGVLEGVDGELIVGSPTAHDVYRQTTSGIMAADKTPDFTFYVFDNCLTQNLPFSQRNQLTLNYMSPRLKILEQHPLRTMEEINIYEQHCLDLGYEGIILKRPDGKYKHGRSTAKQGILLKVKRFTDGEAEIIGMEELMHNGNEKTTNELGRSQRSSHQENKVGLGSMGALICRDLVTGIEFNIGTGFDAATRQHFWDVDYINQIVKYKSFDIGVKDKPRHPVFLGMRDKTDM